MKIEKVLVTPKMAKDWLGKNTFNRYQKKPVINKYANDMANGRWKEDTGELIKFNSQGTLLDGQHRLVALVKANVSVYFHVATGIPDDTFDVLDSGSVRSSKDVFTIGGAKNSNVVSAMITCYVSLKNGYARGGKVDNKPSSAELLEIYLERQVFWDYVSERSMNWYTAFGRIVAPAVWGGFFAFLHEINEANAVEFMTSFANGMEAPHKSILLLRQRLIQDRTSIRKMPRSIKDAYIIKAWNAYRLDSKMKILTFNPSIEDFPTAI